MGQKQSHSNSSANVGRTAAREVRCLQSTSVYRQVIALCAVVSLFQACGHATGQESPKASQATGAAFSGEKAYELLKAQCDFGPRYPGSPGHAKCKEWIVEQCKKYTDTVRTQDFGHIWSKTGKRVAMTNVIAEMQVGSPTTALLVAHWDTRPSADMEETAANRAKPILGANDGASGVAVLLELMRVFKENKPPINLIFLFVDGEDLGPGLDEMFLGASYYAKNLSGPKPAFGILLDMVGDKDLCIPMEPISHRYAPDLLSRFYKHAQAEGYEKYFPSRFQGEIWDDHIPLNEAGIPTIDLIDFDYPYWHTLKDTPDKCSAASLGIVGRVVESFLRKQK